MIVNTKTKTVKPTATEKRWLVQALDVLQGLAKHGDGNLAECAELAATNVDGVLACLSLQAAEVTE